MTLMPKANLWVHECNYAVKNGKVHLSFKHGLLRLIISKMFVIIIIIILLSKGLFYRLIDIYYVIGICKFSNVDSIYIE